MNLQIVGDNIRKLRELRNFTQDYLAERTGVARETIGKIEKGESGVKLETVFKIAKVLEISITQLIDFDPKKIFFSHTTNSLINSNKMEASTNQFDLLSVITKCVEMLQEQHIALMRLVKK